VIESELRWAAGQQAQQISREDPMFHAASAAIESATGSSARLRGFPGGCSGGMALRRGIPAVIIGPGDLAQAHTVDEWIEVEQIGVAARIYAELATRYLA
jgi:acetylornithine deacetylase/succinyl-diaminopimelate desuccinylase-like protein